MNNFTWYYLFPRTIGKPKIPDLDFFNWKEATTKGVPESRPSPPPAELLYAVEEQYSCFRQIFSREKRKNED